MTEKNIFNCQLENKQLSDIPYYPVWMACLTLTVTVVYIPLLLGISQLLLWNGTSFQSQAHGNTAQGDSNSMVSDKHHTIQQKNFLITYKTCYQARINFQIGTNLIKKKLLAVDHLKFLLSSRPP